MAPAASSAVSQTTSFLAEVFQRGSDCPYDPQFQGVIRQQLLELVGDIPSLTVKHQPFTHYDGRSARLLVAEGTVPMYYQGVKYNIPVALWLPERYPLVPPMMYVVPTPDMVIKPRHPFVDPNGLVGSPYLHNWSYPASNLASMAQDASIMFGGDPPLYSKPPGWTPPPGPTPPRPPPPPQQQQQQGATARPQYPPPIGSSGSGPYSPTAFHAENPIHGGSGGSFTGAPSGSFSGAGSGSYAGSTGGSFTNANNMPFTSGPSGSGMGGWAGAITGGMGGMSIGGPAPSGQPPQPPPFQPPASAGALESGIPAQQAQQQAQAQQQQQGMAGPAAKPPPADIGSASEDASRELRGAFRTAALATLTRRLAASSAAAASGATAEADRLAAAQTELARREAQLQQEVGTLQAERIALDRAAQDLGAAAAQLDQWLAGNQRALAVLGGGAEGGAGGGGGAPELDPDSVIVAADPLSQQALEAQAQDLALEDALYALDKALNAGLVQPDAYLKQVRAVCRQQFMARALGNKIAAKQNEARRRSPTRAGPPAQQVGGPPGYGAPAPVPQGVQVAFGDSWINTGILANPLTAQQR